MGIEEEKMSLGIISQMGNLLYDGQSPMYVQRWAKRDSGVCVCWIVYMCSVVCLCTYYVTSGVTGKTFASQHIVQGQFAQGSIFGT